MGDEYSTSMAGYLENEYYQENKLGVYVIDDVLEVSNVKQIDVQDYSSVIEDCEGEDHSAYLVEVGLSVQEENDFYFNGANYNVVLVGTVDGNRRIVGVRLPLFETIAEYEGEEATEAYKVMRFGTDTEAEVNALTSCLYTTNPSTIIVRTWYFGDGTNKTVDFNEYVKVVTAKEYGFVSYPADYHYAGALAVKMYAWHKIVNCDPNNGYHVTDTHNTNATYEKSYQDYNPNDYYTNESIWGVLYNRVDAVWSTNMYGTGYSLMDLQYKTAEGEEHSGILNQEEMLSKIQGEDNFDYAMALNYYYGNSNISSGNIVFVTAGNHVGYQTTDLGNGTTRYTCRCGHVWDSNEAGLNTLQCLQ